MNLSRAHRNSGITNEKVLQHIHYPSRLRGGIIGTYIVIGNNCKEFENSLQLQYSKAVFLT